MDRKKLAEQLDRLEAARADQTKERTVSAIKGHDPDHLKGTSLEKERETLRPAFEKAHDGVESPPAGSIEQRQSMTNAPQHNFNPPDSMRLGADRIAHAEQLRAEQQRANDLNAAIKARQEQAEYGNMNNGQEQERD